MINKEGVTDGDIDEMIEGDVSLNRLYSQYYYRLQKHDNIRWKAHSRPKLFCYFI